MNHALTLRDEAKHRWHCEVCLVTWDGLNDHDVQMLTTRGKCLGQEERWRVCRVDEGLCYGVKLGHERCV